VSPAELYKTLKNGESAEFPAAERESVERAGFVGLVIEGERLRAWKGKDGPCYETGRSARYRGAAAAALDDDKHLLFGDMRLCEKTARVYALPAYAKVVEVGPADPAYAAREPVLFDCDTFERDAATLAASLAKRPDIPRSPVLYPGPFKLLILKDGTMIPRGRPVRAAAEELLRSGEVRPAAEGVEPDNYLDLYAARGALCLLSERMESTSSAPRRLRMSALADATEPMRRRLLKLIERKDDYFILVGSDPADQDGCCPNDDVGHANALVNAGVLEGWVSSAEAACPTTVYAFAGEIVKGGERPEFVKNDALREEVRAYVASKKGLPARVALRLALVLLLLGGAALGLWALARDVWR
jgi:hypothetical protein